MPKGKFTAKGNLFIGPKRPRGRPKGSTSKKKAPTFSAKVKKAVTKMAEKKIFNWHGTFDFGAYTSTVLSTFIIPISPYTGVVAISQGTGQANRIGDRIRTHSCILRGVITPKPWHATTNSSPQPQEVRIWFFSVKGVVQLPTTLGNFFQAGNSAQTPQGTISDLTRIINTDLYTYRGHRTFKIGTADFAGSGGLVDYQYFANNDFKYNQRFTIDCTHMLSAEYKFSDTTNIPQSSTFFFIEAVNANGSGQATNQLVAQINYEIDYRFTDV